MDIVFALIGATLGALAWNGLTGLVFGGLLGWLVASHVELRRKVRAMEQQLTTQRTTAPPRVPDSREAPGHQTANKLTESASASKPTLDTSTQIPIPSSASHSLPDRHPAVPTPVVVSDVQQNAARDTDWITLVTDAIKRYFLGGNTVVRVGILILFFGIAFLLKYAAEQNKLPAEFRLSGTAIGAAVLLVFGWRLRNKRPGYALALQGGGVGILYLTIFAALRLYQLLPPLAALIVLVAICASAATLALLQDSVALAVLGAAGGFLAPILTSTGSGSHVMLFSYYALLNAGILTLAWFKAWRLLNLVGFAFTFIIGTAWGVKFYQPVYFSTTEPFLILFFLIYVAIAVLFAHRQPLQLRGYVDGTLVFGTPIVGFVLQAAIVRDFPYGMAFSALILGAFYIGLASALWRHATSSMRTLTESFLALGIVFATLAVPLALDGRWTAAVWAVEGAGLYWVGQRQSRKLPQIFGVVLQVGAGVSFLPELFHYQADWPWLNSDFVGCALLAAAGIFVGFRVHRYSAWSHAQWLSRFMLLWGTFWWLLGGYNQIDHHVDSAYRIATVVGYLSFTALLAEWAGSRFSWSDGRHVALAALPALAMVFLIGFEKHHHPFAGLGWLSWTIALAAWFLILYRRDREPIETPNWTHYGGVWLIGLIATTEFGWQVNYFVADGHDWLNFAWGVIPALWLWACVRGEQYGRWPFTLHHQTYLMWGGAGAAVIGTLWLLLSSTHPGDPAPLSYFPLFNPLDLGLALFLTVSIIWILRLRTLPDPQQWQQNNTDVWFAGACAFLWLNAMLLRSVHHFGHVPYTGPALFHSVLVQAALSLFWTTLAVVLMVYAARAGHRSVWITGAVLQGVVVAKLFFIELANTGTVERIVSFIGVGILLLAVGYLAPVPPRRANHEASL